MPGFETDDKSKPRKVEPSPFEAVLNGGEKLNGPTGPQQPLDANKKQESAPVAKQGDGVTAPAKPPGEADKSAPAPDKAAADKAAAEKAAAEKAAAEKAAADKAAADKAAADKAAAEKVDPIAQLKKVNDILDKEVPALNKAGKLDEAKLAYEKAIKEAEKVSKEDIEKAKKDLVDVRKKLETETNLEEKTKLKERERELFSVSRVKDAAYGNMALWYYRQGKVEEGNTKLLQGAGVDEESAKKHAKMAPDDLKALDSKVPDLANVTLFDDIYFQRQMVRLRDEKKIGVPEAYFGLHDMVRKANAELEQKQKTEALQQAGKPASGTDGQVPPVVNNGGRDRQNYSTPNPGSETVVSQPGATDKVQAGKDTTIPATGDKTQPAAAYDETKAVAAVDAGIKYFNELEKATDGRKLDDAGKKVAEDAIKAAQARSDAHLQQFMALTKKAEEVVGADKMPGFETAYRNFRTEAAKLQGPDGQLLPAAKPIVERLQNPDPAKEADREAARKEMAEKFPDFVKAKDEFVKAAGSPEKAFAAKPLMDDREIFFAESSKSYNDMVDLRTSYGAALIKNGDKDGAKAQLKELFTGLNEAQVNQLIKGDQAAGLPPRPKLDKLIQDTLGGANPANAGDAASQNSEALIQLDRSKPLADQMKGVAPEKLEAFIIEEQKKGPASVNEVRAAYEELIRQYSDPEMLKQKRELVVGNQKQLEADKKPDGTALTNEDRTRLHLENTRALQDMSYGAVTRLEYAKYLGDFHRRQKMLSDAESAQPYKPGSAQNASAEFVEGGVNQLADMQKWSREAFKAADAMPRELILAEERLQSKNIGRVSDEAALSKAKVFISGGELVLEGGQKIPQLGMKDLSVDMRTEIASIYTFNDMTNAIDLNKTRSEATQRGANALYKPQEAAALAGEALEIWKKNYPDRPNAGLAQLVAFGEQKNPEIFRKQAALAAENFTSPKADMAAMAMAYVGDIGGRALLARYKIRGAANTYGGDIAGIGSAIFTRAAVMRIGTGQWEDFSDTLAHGTAAGLAVTGFKHTSRWMMKPDGVIDGLGMRLKDVNEVSVARGIAGAEANGMKFAQELRSAGKLDPKGMQLLDDLSKPGVAGRPKTEMETLFTKPVKDMTPEEVRKMYDALGMKPMGKVELTELMATVKGLNVKDIARAAQLEAAGITDVASLEARAAAHQQRMSDFMADLDKTAIARDRGRFGAIKDKVTFTNPNTKIEDVVEEMARNNRVKYPDDAAKQAEINFLKSSGVHNLGDMRGYYLEANLPDMSRFMKEAADKGLIAPKSLLTRGRDMVTLSDSQSVRQVLTELKTKGGDPTIIASMEAKLPVLERMGVTNMQQFQVAHAVGSELNSALSLRQRYPEISEITGTTRISELMRRDARAFGENGSATQQRVDAILGKVPEKPPGMISSTISGAKNWVFDAAYRDRFWNVGDINRAVQGRDARNWGRINTETSSLEAMQRAASSMRSRATMAGALSASIAYNGITSVYDMSYDTDINGNTRKVKVGDEVRQLTPVEAFTRSMVGSGDLTNRIQTSAVADVLLGSMILKPIANPAAQTAKEAWRWAFVSPTLLTRDNDQMGESARLKQTADMMERPLQNEDQSTGTVFEKMQQEQQRQAVPPADANAGKTPEQPKVEQPKVDPAKAEADRKAAEAKAKADREAEEARKRAAQAPKQPNLDPSTLAPGEGFGQ
ncbi:MAG: hypothetical protein SFV17_11785 [Candidatus Obscuribacter sp.]|nr:hypothetical protein [Candidatus Obscuribacter sp.]